MLFLVLLLTLGAAGAWIANRWLQERDQIVLAALAIPIGLVWLLVGTNFALRCGCSLTVSLTTTWVSLATFCLGLRLRPAVSRVPANLRVATWTVLGLVAAFLLLYTNQGQVQSLDDDYWIHTPLQTEMLLGVYPPRNPFFSELPLNGHFGRDLLIVAFTKMSGMSTFRTQMEFTTAVQLVSLLLLFATLWRFTTSRVEALTGTVFIYFGADVAYRAGLFDAYTNNATVVYTWLWLVLFLVLKLWETRDRSALLTGAVTLGSFAYVYETHFGLAILATGFTALALRLPPRTVLLTVLLVVLALPQAFSQGGVLTDLASRRLGRTVAPATMGVLNQSQSAELHFPKKELGCIREGFNETQPVSVGFGHWPGSVLSGWVSRPTPGVYSYSPIWSKQVLKMQWLGLFLCPLSLAVLLRFRHAPGLWLWSFGMSAYLVPALIDFGPIHEFEYFRWELAAGLGLSGALGLAAARLTLHWAGDPEPRWDTAGDRLMFSFKPIWRRWLALAILVWLCCQTGFWMSVSFVQSNWRFSEAALLEVSTPDWLVRMGQTIGFTADDVRAAQWMAARMEPGHQRLLMNFHEDPGWLGFESLFAGINGAFLIGHALPLDSDAVGTPPFRMSSEAVAFWRSPNPDTLRALHPDWIYLIPGAQMNPVTMGALEHLPGVVKVWESRDLRGARVLYRVRG